jgi:peptidoglycan/LPS O-acetylase OafA/YrhL
LNTSNKLDSLTFLRFIAAISVVIYHFGSQTIFYQLLPAILKAGPLMVTFFFVLSGFVISIAHVNKPLSIGSFYLNRIARIFPAYLLALVLYTTTVGSSFLGADFLLPLSLLQAWIPGDALRGNAPGWSVSVEMFFYAVAPALIFLSSKQYASNWRKWFTYSSAIWLIGLACVTLMAQKPFYGGYPSPTHDIVFYFPLSHASSFLLGFAGGIAYKNGFLKNKFSNTSLAAALFIFMAIINEIWFQAVLIDRTNPTYKMPYSSGFFALPFLVIIYLCAITEKTLSNIFKFPAITLLGEASYAIYIFQMPIALAVNKYIPESASFSPNIKFGLYFTILLTVSVVSYKLIEAPVTRAIRKKYSRVSLSPAAFDQAMR